QRLEQPRTGQDRRDRRLFWEDVRGAKERLSRSTVAPVPIPGSDTALHLTREELEHVIGPLIRRASAQTASVVRQCRVEPRQSVAILLVGGSSRIPLVARVLHTELRVAPTVLEQPELPVAEGAVAIRMGGEGATSPARPPASAPVSPVPVPPVHVSPVPAPPA